MAIVTDTTTDANGNIIINVSSSADDAIALATAGTYSDKNIIFNLTTSAETDPTVPAWAKAESKPSYTASEVGADPSGSASQALKDAKSYTDTQISAIPTLDVSG